VVEQAICLENKIEKLHFSQIIYILCLKVYLFGCYKKLLHQAINIYITQTNWSKLNADWIWFYALKHWVYLMFFLNYSHDKWKISLDCSVDCWYISIALFKNLFKIKINKLLINCFKNNK